MRTDLCHTDLRGAAHATAGIGPHLGSPPAKPAPAAVLDSAKGMLVFAVLIEAYFQLLGWFVGWRANGFWLWVWWFWLVWSGFGFLGREAGKQGCRTFPSIWCAGK